MINEGVATKADGLSVRVKVNEAEMTLTKVEDGLSLARMLLCQLCGIDLSSPITLADENMEDIPLLTTDLISIYPPLMRIVRRYVASNWQRRFINRK